MLGACLVFAPIRSLGAGQLALAGAAGVVVAAYALVLHEQLAEHPWLPGRSRIRSGSEAQGALGVPLVPLVSIARNQPWFELGRPLVCMLAISCGFLVGADAGRARQLLKVIAWSGAAYAAYGILAHFSIRLTSLWRDKEAYLDSVTGTFINRNTAGAYFGSCAVVWSLLLWEQLRREMPRGPLEWRTIPARLFSNPSKKVVDQVSDAVSVPRGHVHDMVARRGGALAVGAHRGVHRVLPARPADVGPGYSRRLPAAARSRSFCCSSWAAASTPGSTSRASPTRAGWRPIESTLRMIADHPWFGTGQGTFAYAFPAYRSPNVSMWGVWDIAHNTLLEIAADMGVPIAALVVVAWIVIFAVLVHGTRVRRRGLIFPVAALAVAMLAVLHSLIDFSLQIPGYSIVALSLIGAGLAQSFVGDHSRRERVGCHDILSLMELGPGN